MALGVNIAVLLGTAVGSTVLIGLVLWWGLGRPLIETHGSWTASQTFDFTKIVLSIVGGIGGVVALVIAYRKQRLGESAEQRENAKLFAENFTKATEQLGSDQAAVRLAGMYALERLAQTAEQQQTVVNVLCAYLRMPNPTPRSANGEATNNQSADGYDTDPPREYDRGKLEVRLTAQRMLTTHLRYRDRQQADETFWPDIDLDLTGAVLLDIDLSRCHVRSATFDQAQFHGAAKFDGMEFHADANFARTRFHDRADFAGVQFHADVNFVRARFRRRAVFTEAQFHSSFTFSGAGFYDHGSFAYPRVRLDVPEGLRRDPPKGYAVVGRGEGTKPQLSNAHGVWGHLGWVLD
jgi:uncharacterized protein YjbI with pentapeptide repeats